MSCTIEISGNRAYFSGDYPMATVRKITSYAVESAFFTPAYKRGHWDGRKYLFDTKTKSIPAGLVPSVVACLRKEKYLVSVVDLREDNVPAVGNKGFELQGKLKGLFGKGIYDFQQWAAEACVRHVRGILKMATNSGKGAVAAAVTQHLALPTLFVVPGQDLLYQTEGWMNDLLGIEVGLIGDQQFKVGDWVTVATMQSLKSRLDKGDLDREKDWWDVVFLDECHVGGSETAYDALNNLSAYYRFGMSGTPLDRTDGATLRLIAQTGEVIYEVSNSLLVERGISVQPLVKLIRIDKPQIKPKKGEKLTYSQVNDVGVINNMTLNQAIVDELMPYLNAGKRAVVFVDKLRQGDIIDLLLMKEGFEDRVFFHGGIKAKERRQILEDFSSGKIRCMIGTSVLNQGIDLDCIDVMVFAGGGKSIISVLQRSGRGLRSGNDRDAVVIIDVMNMCHKWLTKHSKKRLQTYKNEECFKISMIHE